MNNQYFLDRIAGRNPNLRASDEDRERIAERLRRGHAEGRLDMGEFQERLEHCYEARTFGELDDLVRDLPRQDHANERQPRVWARPWPLLPLLVALIVVLAAASGHHHHLSWLWIPVVYLFWRLSWGRRGRWAAGSRRGPGGWA